MTIKEDILWTLVARRSPRSVLICRKCLLSRRHNSNSSAAAVASISDPSGPDSLEASHIEPAAASIASQSPPYKINAAVLVSRPPILTRDLTSFEKAFFLYQRRLNERSALPFTRYFYYEKNTPGEVEWKRKIKERLTASRDIGRYSGYGKESWNDEVLVGSDLSEPEAQREALIKDSEVAVKRRDDQGQEVIMQEELERPMPRTTEADEKDDRRSLNRALARTLYLVVKGKRGAQGEQWMFPAAELSRDEALHYGAERIITQSAGTGMSTWVVGKMPIGHSTFNYPQPIINKEKSSEILGEKTFYMKARIMAGTANLENNQFGLLDYQWLAKEEIQKAFTPFHWGAVKNILAER